MTRKKLLKGDVMQWEMINGTLLTPNEEIRKGSLRIDNDEIGKISKSGSTLEKGIKLDLNGLIVLPGLIDAHDHLLGTYMPRVGDRRPYLNWLVWDNDLKASPIYSERQLIDSADLYLLGGYRHLISGVTSVQDHMPHFVQDMFKKNSPVKIVDDYAVYHSITSFALNWGGSIEEEHSQAAKNNIPFIAHCSEGFDQETLDSVKTLQKHNALSKNTVLVHGIAFTDEDIAILKKQNCHVVWCPYSNLYMYGKTAPIKKLLDAGINVSLGTDSPMSGSTNIFEEMRTAAAYYRETFGEELGDKTVVKMLTENPAKALSLHDRGLLKEKMKGDLLVIDGDNTKPYSAVTSMDFENIMLVVIDGIPIYGDISFARLFEALEVDYHRVMVASSAKIINGDALGLLQRIQRAVGFKKQLPFLPIGELKE